MRAVGLHLSFVPGCYWLLVRTKSWRSLLGHLLYYPGVYLSYFLYGTLIAGNRPHFEDFLRLFGYWAAYVSIYEIGYVWNDTKAVKLEASAVRRTVPALFGERVCLFVCLRVAAVAAILAALWGPGSGKFVAAAALTLAVFGAHNSRAKEKRYTTFCGLRFLRHSWPALLFAFEAVVAAQLISFALVYSLVESLHYLGLSGSQRRSMFLVGAALSFASFAAVDRVLNWCLYPLTLVVAGSCRDAVRRGSLAALWCWHPRAVEPSQNAGKSRWRGWVR